MSLRYLEMLVRDRPRSLKMAPVDFWSAIVGLTMAVSGTVFEIKRDIRQKSQFSYPLPILHDCVIFSKMSRVPKLLDGAKIADNFDQLCTIVTNDRQTDGHAIRRT